MRTEVTGLRQARSSWRYLLR